MPINDILGFSSLAAQHILRGFPINPTTGKVDIEASEMAYNNSTRTFTLTPTGSNFIIWRYGIKHVISSQLSIIVPSAETYEGLHWIVFTGTGLRSIYQSILPNQEFDIITEVGNDTVVSAIYWDSVNLKELTVVELRQPIGIDYQSFFRMLSDTIRWKNGGELTEFVIGDGSLEEHARFAIEEGNYYIGRIQHVVQKYATDVLDFQIIYMNGSTPVLRKGTPPSGHKVLTTGSGRLAFNENIGGVWQLTEITNNYHINYHYFKGPDFRRQCSCIVGIRQYQQASEAIDFADLELNEIKSKFKLDQFKGLGTVTFNSRDTYANSVKAKVVPLNEILGIYYTDLRGRVGT